MKTSKNIDQSGKMTSDIDIKGATDAQLLEWFNANSGGKARKSLGKDRAEAEALVAELKQALIELSTGNSKNPGKPAKGEKKSAAAKPAKGEKKSAAKKEKTGEGKGQGRSSIHSGKKIFILPAHKKENPRREGTHGHRSFGVLQAALPSSLTYEEYIEKGGRTNDLAWDINKGYVEVR